MDGIILAGGMGKRMRPLTLATPKPLLPLQGQPILAWSLTSLRDLVDHVLVVAHYLREQIERYLSRQRIVSDVTIVQQHPAPLGTGHALACCQDYLRSDDFLVINGDDLYARASLRRLSQCDYGILTMMRRDFDQYGVLLRDDRGRLLRIDEKPSLDRYASPAPCNIGGYKLKREIFDYRLELSARGEYEITDILNLAARDHSVALVDCPFWLPIGDRPALERAQSADLRRWLGEPAS